VNVKEHKITALIVDDEQLARAFIRRLLSEDTEVQIIGECTNGKEAVAMIQKHDPDLVFLDIQMPELDGLGVVEAIGLESLPHIVFTTAYDRYAIQAFDLHATDYLLKPFDHIRFQDALKRVKQSISISERNELVSLSALLEALKQKPKFLSRLTIRSGGRITLISTNDIRWIEADDKYVHLHTDKQSQLVRQTLTALEAQLDPAKFQRIHRSAIVNIDYIKELQGMFGGEHIILLNDGTKLTLSRKYKERFFTSLGRPL
jgi:two-component system LytT family response regulator